VRSIPTTWRTRGAISSDTWAAPHATSSAIQPGESGSSHWSGERTDQPKLAACLPPNGNRRAHRHPRRAREIGSDHDWRRGARGRRFPCMGLGVCQ
jgi:hypothetical protein